MSIREQSTREHDRATKALERFDNRVKAAKGTSAYAAAKACIPYLRRMLNESKALREAELKERKARQHAERAADEIRRERDALRRKIEGALGHLSPNQAVDGLAAVGLGDARD